MTDQVLQDVRCKKKAKCPGKDGILIDLITKATEEFSKMLAMSFLNV